MANRTVYVCLNCGATQGSNYNADLDTDEWMWRLVPHGRVGPFCTWSCARLFSLDPHPTYTLSQWPELAALQRTYRPSLDHWKGVTPKEDW